jgi:hypothetical protein
MYSIDPDGTAGGFVKQKFRRELQTYLFRYLEIVLPRRAGPLLQKIW